MSSAVLVTLVIVISLVAVSACAVVIVSLRRTTAASASRALDVHGADVAELRARAEADALVLHAIVVNAAIGATLALLVLVCGPALYRALGGEGASLAAALADLGLTSPGTAAGPVPWAERWRSWQALAAVHLMAHGDSLARQVKPV